MALRIGLIQAAPLATSCAINATCPSRGYAVDATLFVCENLKLNCTFVWFDSKEYGDIDENGRGSGLVGAIQSGKFDTSLPLITPTYRRSRGLEFSQAYFYDDIVLVTRTPQDDNDDKLNLNVIYAFQWPVWCFFVSTLVLTGVFLTWSVRKFYRDYETPLLSSSNPLFAFFDVCWATIITEHRDAMLEIGSFRILIIFWAWISLVLTSAYTGILFSQKVSVDSDVPFTDMETFVQCLERDECRIVTHTVTISYLQHFIAPGTDIAARIDLALRRNPILVLPQPMVPDRILREKEIYLVWVRTSFGIHYATGGNRNCSFYIVDAQYQEAATFPMRKNSSKFLETLNKAANHFRENALAGKMKSKYLIEASCSRSQSNSDNEDGASYATGLYEERTTFYFYIFGTVFGVVVFLVEFLYVSAQLPNPS